ncbi:MAG TPA: tRNA (adenosine(37)-N6)-dimethylallyltransferase MiaA [Pirellulales bacterium]|jgi:tRNA dimethylallyltransferase|nr:tRNA (adenosine(37)-N6)-dimethylallyltransferase MiaA [Pirellulales bacterium]
MSPTHKPRDCWFLTGATASGKTAVGVALARRLGAEIVSLDSMAIYRGMNVGTAKPTPEEQGGVPHHLIDVASPSDEFSVAEYVAAAERTVAEIADHGREAIFVGGTPLYLKALLRGIDAGPPADWTLRTRLVEWGRQAGPGALHQRLAAVDPAAAARLHESDTRRLVRALEVFEQTGRTISSQQQHFSLGRPAEACRVFVLDWPREQLYERINRRVDAMFNAGLLDEVRELAETVPGTVFLGRTAGQAVGYREAAEVLAGRLTLPAAIELTQTRTRQFAKRQLTWFRSLSECRFVPVEEPLDPEAVAERIAAMM